LPAHLGAPEQFGPPERIVVACAQDGGELTRREVTIGISGSDSGLDSLGLVDEVGRLAAGMP
jgi:hypothetical protein